MNLPNKLTVMRVIAVPFFVVLMLAPISGEPCEGWCKWVALALFIIASLTDLVDAVHVEALDWSEYLHEPVCLRRKGRAGDGRGCEACVILIL